MLKIAWPWKQRLVEERGRRVAFLSVSLGALATLLGLPEHTRILEVRPSCWSRVQGIELFIESPEFPEVEENQECPLLHLDWSRVNNRSILTKIVVEVKP